MVSATDNIKDLNGAHTILAKFRLKRNESITQAFERISKEKMTYLHHQHMYMEIRVEIVCWVVKNKCPFAIVNDCGFQDLMKTGHPKY